MTRFSRLIMIALLWSVPLGAMAQQPATAPTQPLLKPAELDQLLAPIALHPDPLLSEVLIASTYPLEVVQADRWAKSNKALKGDALTAALAKQSWDDSVKSLVQVPSVLAMMSEQLDWTQKLGDAVLAQQADVMDSIQRLRARARANGKLESTKEQTVTVKTEDQKQYVVIEPTSPTEIYVPYYEPAAVYGDWPNPDYAPYYFPPPYGYIPGAALATGVAFAAGVAVRHAFWGNCDWGRGNINVVANRSVDIANINRGKWEHNADHRQGVKYNNADVRQKFAKTDIQAGKAARQDFRGKDGQKVLEPDRDRPGAGDRERPTAGDRERAAAGDRDRPTAGDRDRPGAGDRDRPQARNTGGRPDAGKGGRPGQKVSSKAGQKASGQPSQKASPRPSKPQRDTAFANVQSGPKTHAQANRGRQSVGGGGGAPRMGGGGAPRMAAPGGGGRGGGGRRSDIALKHDITLLGRLNNGLGFYRFSYNGSNRVYVGVMAQEAQTIIPEAVVRGRDGYLEVFYDKLGLKFQTYEQWIASGAQVPTVTRIQH
ncbi:MAG: hypothetical protein AUI16_14740 [Alphaproteobacteria bacterium 13_2_20CM_2_64_7]|nr:MAG: hypothetical protein AUI16_14740 [Alphaproteobacteria bacterium 13_2_20CM_2_64_7]